MVASDPAKARKNLGSPVTCSAGISSQSKLHTVVFRFKIYVFP